MSDITEAQLKAGLSARYANLRRAGILKPEIIGQRLRQGIDAQQAALRQRVARPSTPIFIALDTPFLIWANRFLPNSTDPLGTNILVDSHIESLNNWAKILLNYSKDDSFSATDRLNFYFLWRNETGGDAVVNITSSLTLIGSCKVHANGSFWHGVAAPNFSQVSVDAVLSVFEWWNQPPTEPLPETSQTQNVTSLSVQGGVWSGDGRSKLFSGNFPVAYNSFHIPSNDVGVFEVGVSLNWALVAGDVNVDFSFQSNIIQCPSLLLEVITASAKKK
jgi:hypothetical protein